MTFHKRILEWQAAHPNLTWALLGNCLGDCSDTSAPATESAVTAGLILDRHQGPAIETLSACGLMSYLQAFAIIAEHFLHQLP